MPEDSQLNNQGGFEEKPEQSPPPLDKNQKMAAAGLAVFAVLIIVMWFAQLKNNIYGPFNGPAGENQVVEAPDSPHAQKYKDTDGDGLNDFDELNLYNTSPYLADTDGDGFKDGEEIKNNADPNCPAGRDCTGGLLDNTAADQATNTPAASNDVLNNLLNQFGASQPQAQPATGANSLSPDQLNAFKNIDAPSLRQLLLKAGMSKATLDKISDADLLKSFQETLIGQ